MASIEVLPDKVLSLIFRKLEFPHLIWVSVVSSRWNRVIFQLLDDRVQFRLTENDGMANLSRLRTYKHVSLREDQLLNPVFSASLLLTLGRTAESLEIDCRVVNPELLLFVLSYFRSVVKLKLAVQVFYGSQMDVASFLQQARGFFPEVRLLTIEAMFYKTLGLLAEMGPNLVILDVRVREQLLPKFYECRFDNLKELTFRLTALPIPFQPSCFRAVDLVNFLSRQNNLRKLELYVTDDFSSWDFSKLCAIEDLTLNSNISDINGLSRMACLRSLSCNYQMVFFRDREPVPSLKTLQVIKSSVQIEQLTRLFPNLTALVLREGYVNLFEMQQIVCAWPSLEELSFEMSGLDGTELVPLQKLRKLRKLCVTVLIEDEADLAPFYGVLALESIRQLHIFASEANDAATLKKWNAKMLEYNRRCAIVIENEPAKVDCGQSANIHLFDF